MAKVVGVRFKKTGKVYYFDPQDLELENGMVVVETANGMECAEMVFPPREVPDDQISSELKKVVRQATQQDEARMCEREDKKEEALRICQQKIEAHKLEMKLIDVDIAFDGTKITFFFTADGRVDFRELVKDLAHVFRTRIELRQIGVRDETKMMGGIGACGRVCCCTSFLNEFAPVSIKMAKEQSLSLNPTKISGLCGRLMCCLKYEQNYYEQARKQMPRTGKEIKTPDGVGTLLENNVLKKTCRVRVTLPDETVDIRTYTLDEIARAEAGLPPLKKEPEHESEALETAMTYVSRRTQGRSQANTRQQPRADKPQRAERTQQQRKRTKLASQQADGGQAQERSANAPHSQRVSRNAPHKQTQQGQTRQENGKTRGGAGGRASQAASRGRQPRPQTGKSAEAEAVTLRPAAEVHKSPSARRKNHSARRRPRPQGRVHEAEEMVRLVPATPKQDD